MKFEDVLELLKKTAALLFLLLNVLGAWKHVKGALKVLKEGCIILVRLFDDVLSLCKVFAGKFHDILREARRAMVAKSQKAWKQLVPKMNKFNEHILELWKQLSSIFRGL